MKRAIWTLASLGMLTLLVTLAPDIRRYLRIRCM
ncbi:DUF6893 family small protein [Alloacidobacterium dinghuense]